MKNTRKILVVLLALALFIASFSVFAFAEEGSGANDTAADDSVSDSGETNSGETESGENGSGDAAVDTTDYAAEYVKTLAAHNIILEYFEAGNYLNARFDSDASDADFDSLMNAALSDSIVGFELEKGAAFSAVVSDGAAQISSVGATKFVINPDDLSSFGLNIRAKFSSGSSISLYLVDSVGEQYKAFSVSDGKVSYEYDYENKVYLVDEESAVAADSYFTLECFVNRGEDKDTVTVTVTAEDGASKAYSYSVENDYTDISNGKFDFSTAYMTTSSATFDYIEIYPGVSERMLVSDDNVSIVSNAILAMYQDYLLYTEKGVDASELAEIIAKIVVIHGFEWGEETEEAPIAKAVRACIEVTSKLYYDAYEAGIENISSDKAYKDRLSVIDSISYYRTFFDNLAVGDYEDVYATYTNPDGEYKLSFAKEDDEVAALNALREQTIASVEAAFSVVNIYLATYEEYKTLFEVFADNPICETFYDETISAEDVLHAIAVKRVVNTEFPKLRSAAEAFVANVAIAADTSLTFAERYAAYDLAKSNYFTDTTYNAYITDTTIEELISLYNEIDAEMSEVSVVAEEFLAKIREAELSPSYSVKDVALDKAETYLNIVEVGYPGVAEAIEKYATIRKDIDAKIEATKQYIQAVLNIEIAQTVSDKKIAIGIAELYAVEGNDVSVEINNMEITVTQANVILSNQKSAIALEETRINNYVSTVNAIASKTTLAERRAVIVKALAMKESLNPEEEAVAEASLTLDSKVADYNAEVKKANTKASEGTQTAVSVLAKTVPTKRIAEVVAIIKKFYE